MNRYCGWYAKPSRGKRKRDKCAAACRKGVKTEEDAPEIKKRRKCWTALIQKVYAADPMICPDCGRKMRIIAFVDQWEIGR